MNFPEKSESEFLKNQARRTGKFRVNQKLIDLLNEMEALLGPPDREARANFDLPKYPVCFIIGNPRSGTTLLLQQFAQSRYFSYPSNFLSRFYYAPYIGAKLSRMLFDPEYDFQNELTLEEKVGFDSSLGKTTGPANPSEFFHYWRQFLPIYDPEYMDQPRLDRADFAGLYKGFAALEEVLEKPLALKAIICQYNLRELIKAFPLAFFLQIKREPRYVMQSILRARRDFYGRDDLWWSVKPREYESLKNESVWKQIAGQVYFTNQAIEKQFTGIPVENQLTINYGELCENPGDVLSRIIGKLRKLCPELPRGELFELTGFPPRDEVRIPMAEMDKLESAYSEFQRS